MRPVWHSWSPGRDGIRRTVRSCFCSFWPWQRRKFLWDLRWFYKFIAAASPWM